MAKLRKIALAALVVFLVFSGIALSGIHIAYTKVFSRAGYDEYDKSKFLTYDEIDTSKYPRETVLIKSGSNMLSGYLYGAANNRGLIIVSPGHRDPNDIKLYEILYFVDMGWQVLCYDYTGCYNSEGENMVGYMQATDDLDAVLGYVETNRRFSGIPVMLFGHSLGAYASTTVLYGKHDVKAVVAASGFDDPKEQWKYSVKRYTGIIGPVFEPYADIYFSMRFGNNARCHAIDAINSKDTPVLIISGTDDEYYGGMSKLYERRNEVTNINCTFMLMREKNHCGHYDYFLSDKAIEHKNKVKTGSIQDVDKKLYMEHDLKLMDKINQFYMDSLKTHF